MAKSVKQSSFLEHILELMRPLGGISARAMFGGHGIYKEGKMFAIVTNEELYLKVTDRNHQEFKERGLAPFTYKRKGKTVALSYHTAPAECLDDARVIAEWVEKSL